MRETKRKRETDQEIETKTTGKDREIKRRVEKETKRKTNQGRESRDQEKTQTE